MYKCSRLVPLRDELDQSVVHLLGVRSTQEVLAILDDDQVGVWRVGEQLNLLLCILDRVDRIARALPGSSVSICAITSEIKRMMATTDVQPHDRADDVEQPPMQAISLPQINRRHPRPPPSGITPVVILNGLLPEIPDAAVAVLAEPDVNQEVAERVFGLKVGGRFGGSPIVDGTCACVDTVPAAELTCAFRLVVH